MMTLPLFRCRTLRTLRFRAAGFRGHGSHWFALFALTAALAGAGCRRSDRATAPGSSLGSSNGASAAASLRPPVIFAWRADERGVDAALLGPANAPVKRLIAAPGESNLISVDAALAAVSAYAPRVAGEPAQAGVIRILVEPGFVREAERPGLLGWMNEELDDAVRSADRAAARLENARQELGKAAPRPAFSAGREGSSGRSAVVAADAAVLMEEGRFLAMALQHRSEVLRQLARSYQWLTANAAGSVLTNAAEVASAHGQVATECLAAADSLVLAATRAAWLAGGDSAAPEPGRGGAGAVQAGGVLAAILEQRSAFPSELARCLAGLDQWLPGRPVATGTSNEPATAPVPDNFFGRLALVHDRLPAVTAALAATAEAWKARAAAFGAEPQAVTEAPAAGPSSNRLRRLAGVRQPLIEAMAEACDIDRAALDEIDRRCTRISPANAKQDVRVAYHDLALAARRAAAVLETAAQALHSAARGARG